MDNKTRDMNTSLDKSSPIIFLLALFTVLGAPIFLILFIKLLKFVSNL